MTDEEVLGAVEQLVATGEYLDRIPGVPGAALSGGGVFREDRRLYVRGSPEHLEAREAGLVERLPPLEPAKPGAVDEAERAIGFPLPALLRRLYVEVGNGGFGPGYGLYGVAGGHATSFGWTVVDLYRRAHASGTAASPVPEGLLPICDWGCGIESLVDLADDEGGMWASDPNPGIDDDLFREPLTFVDWLGRWTEGRLRQPGLIEDPSTGEWRGATEADWLAWAEDELGA